MKPQPMFLACAIACIVAVPAHAGFVTHTGSTSLADPTYNRADADPTTGALSVLPNSAGNGVRYNQYSFTVGTAGAYSFLTAGTYDTYTFLYSPTFAPAQATTNGLVGNDDLFTVGTSGFVATLQTNTSYTLVTTSFLANQVGFFSTTIGGVGTVTPAVVDPIISGNPQVLTFTGDTASGSGYNTRSFTVGTSGEYSFLTTGDFDTYTGLYSSFDPTYQNANLLDSNDDYFGVGNSAFSYNLIAGVTYTFVTEGYSDSDRGLFSNTITGPGAILAAPAAVPEPAAFALMLAGFGAIGFTRRHRSAAVAA